VLTANTLFGLFNIIYGVSRITMGIHMRQIAHTEDRALENTG
jgi:hypothetical protein